MSGRYDVAFLAGHGIGPEVTAEASRAIAAASRLHGFEVDEQHVLFGADAFMRFGHPYPPSSRRAVLDADAVVVGPGGEPVDPLEADLALRASVTWVRFDDWSEVSVLAPLGEDDWGWTLTRAAARARASRGQLTLVGAAAELDPEPDGLTVERVTASEAFGALVVAPVRFDVIVCDATVAAAASDVAACTATRRIAAWGRLAESGPSLFGAGLDPEHALAGHGVADPSPMLLAAALMLAEGLDERAAAATLAGALSRAASVRQAPSTRGHADTVLSQMPLALGVEFLPEAV